ncbi:MAG: hypothetical protein IJY15_14865 [Thermoguttaceae bacterium]|nr:hypothetical protein [Thermoguttaceae bacterium]
MKIIELPDENEPQKWLLVRIAYRFNERGTLHTAINKPFRGESLGEQAQDALEYAGDAIRETMEGWEVLPNRIEISLEDYDKYAEPSEPEWLSAKNDARGGR